MTFQLIIEPEAEFDVSKIGQEETPEPAPAVEAAAEVSEGKKAAASEGAAEEAPEEPAAKAADEPAAEAAESATDKEES